MVANIEGVQGFGSQEEKLELNTCKGDEIQ
jgi:hypothetical protein